MPLPVTQAWVGGGGGANVALGSGPGSTLWKALVPPWPQSGEFGGEGAEPEAKVPRLSLWYRASSLMSCSSEVAPSHLLEASVLLQREALLQGQNQT